MFVKSNLIEKGFIESKTGSWFVLLANECRTDAGGLSKLWDNECIFNIILLSIKLKDN